jgi:hypothetical protein
MGEGRQVPPDEVCEPLVQRYYEEGLARFEAFWASGQGMYKDAHLHVYSMLCNNLAIKYRMQQRYDEAAALHHKGLSSSPFAEHHDGLLWCAIGKDDRAGIVTAAEQLWHFSQDYGYSRHAPATTSPARHWRSTSWAGRVRSASGWNAWTSGSRNWTMTTGARNGATTWPR